MAEEKFDQKITLADIEVHTVKYGARRTNSLLSALGVQSKANEALMSEIGQQLLRSVMSKMKALYIKIFENNASEKERMEYVILRDLLNMWGKQLATYKKLKDKLLDEQGGNDG